MAEITECDSGTVTKLKTRLNHIYKVIDVYRWIIEAYVSDFYVKDHWSRLPSSWRLFLEQMDFSALSCLLSGQSWSSATTGTSVSPLSLLALKAFIEHYALKRQFVDLQNPRVAASVSQTLLTSDGSSACPDTGPEDGRAPDASDPWTSGAVSLKNGQLMEMEHIFRKHVKPKKQHEIRQLGKVIQLVAHVSGSDCVVDVGAGLGHLSRLLTFAHGLKVTTVEAAGGHAPKATEFDRELKKDIQKKLKRREPSDQQEATTSITPVDLPNHVVSRVEPDISTEDFLALVLHGDCDKGAGEGEPSSSCSTQTAPVSGDAGSMMCEESTPRKCSHGVGESNEQEAAASPACPSPRVPTISGDQVTADVVGASDASHGSSAAGVGSGETAAKISRYDGEFESSSNDREGLTPTQNRTQDSHVLVSRGIPSCSEGAISDAFNQSDPSRTSCQSKRQNVNSLNKDMQQDRSRSLGKTSHHPSKHERETHFQKTVNLNECNTKTLKCHSQTCETQTADDELKSSSVSVNDTAERGLTDSVQKDWFVHQQSGGQEEGSHSLHPDTVSAGNEGREPHWEEGSVSDDRDKPDCAQSDKLSSSSQEGGGGGERGGGGGGRRGLVLAGLHACGDLTATMLRVFVNCPAVSALVSVGCCYMKLTHYSEGDEADCERGYPMSQFVRSLPAHPLTYEAREMACHFADAYAQRLVDNPPHLKIHSYRAAVQYVVTCTRPDFVPGVTRLVIKKGAEIPFPQYAEQCLRRLGIDGSEVADDVMATAEAMTLHWRRVVAFYTLRLSLAPLVETAVLLDRMLFLHEQGIPSVAVPVFDSALSPRNFALLACKPQSALGLPS